MAYTANIIPTMTSATAPSGVASASSEYDYAWFAFDQLNTSTWVAYAFTGWLQYQLPAAHVVTQYAVTSDIEGVPKTWTFQGSNDGAAWDTLDTQTNIMDWDGTPNVRKVFPFVNVTAYAYYRLDITALTGGGYVRVRELEMMEALGLAITSMSAHTGPTAGGTSTVITGTGFSGASAVTFGGTAAASYVVDSDTQITATTPAHAAGNNLQTVVTGPLGASADTANDNFTFTDVIITCVPRSIGSGIGSGIASGIG